MRRHRGPLGALWSAVCLLSAAILVVVATPVGATSPLGAESRGRIRIVDVSPADGTHGVGGTAPIVIAFSVPLGSSTGLPVISPPVGGTWQRDGRDLEFRPTGAYLPEVTVTVTVPGGTAGIESATGARLSSNRVFSFTVGDGSVLRAQQLLARLGYLPVEWRPKKNGRLSLAAATRAAFVAPRGSFWWRFVPQVRLRAEFGPGEADEMLTGALMSFEQADGLSVDGKLGAGVWSALIQAGLSPARYANRAGYVYALASKSVPETLTVWRNATVEVRTLANTGISQAPTADGTFAVYLRLKTQVMKGTDPSGQKYSDPVAWVAYFNGSEAVHYIDRSAFGWPQSLGCVEVPYDAGERAWPLLHIGALVIVAG